MSKPKSNPSKNSIKEGYAIDEIGKSYEANIVHQISDQLEEEFDPLKIDGRLDEDIKDYFYQEISKGPWAAPEVFDSLLKPMKKKPEEIKETISNELGKLKIEIEEKSRVFSYVEYYNPVKTTVHKYQTKMLKDLQNKDLLKWILFQSKEIKIDLVMILKQKSIPNGME